MTRGDNANGDEARYPDRRASFTKGLRHDPVTGLVAAPADFDAMRDALEAGEAGLRARYATPPGAAQGQSAAGLDDVPLAYRDPNGRGNERKLVSPKAALSVDIGAADPIHYQIPPAPRFDSAQTAAEIVENYWMARLRDVPFTGYATNPMAAEAVADLTALGADFTGPAGGPAWAPAPTAQTLFRGLAPGEAIGPYISQFLLLPAPYGAEVIDRRMRTRKAGVDYGTTWNEFIEIQNGQDPAGKAPDGALVDLPDQGYEAHRTFIRNGRDLSE